METEESLCPGCNRGRLHPRRVTLQLPPESGSGGDCLDGWVAVCVGNRDQLIRDGVAIFGAHGEVVDASRADKPSERLLPPCGFSMPMTPHRLGESA